MENENRKSGNGWIVAILVIGLLAFIGVLSNKEDHNDGKCDICGKSSTYSDGNEEYCDKHLESAVNWYLKQGE